MFLTDEAIKDWVLSLDLDDKEDVLVPTGLATACLGIDPSEPARLIYSKPLIIEALMEQGMQEEDAHDYMGFNIVGGYVGPHTPIWADTP